LDYLTNVRTWNYEIVDCSSTQYASSNWTNWTDLNVTKTMKLMKIDHSYVKLFRKSTSLKIFWSQNNLIDNSFSCRSQIQKMNTNSQIYQSEKTTLESSIKQRGSLIEKFFVFNKVRKYSMLNNFRSIWQI
jgi:hypothetical protein